MTTNQRSMRSLAQEAGIQPSIVSRFLRGETTLQAETGIKLSNMLAHTLPAAEYQAFLASVGLLPRSGLVLPASVPSGEGAGEVQQLAMQWRQTGDALGHQYLHRDSIAAHRTAEALFHTETKQAARVAIDIALSYAELGDYHQALAEAVRIEAQYGQAHPELALDIATIRGWCGYYLGTLTDAAAALKRSIVLAEGQGNALLGETAWHFLGRVYFASAWSTTTAQEQQIYLHSATEHFAEAYRLHTSMSETYQAFDLFRLAQVRQFEGQWLEARRLRTRARQMFKREADRARIALEEARLAVMDTGDVAVPRRTIHQVLDVWQQVGHAKELSTCLATLSMLEYVQGHLDAALELSIVAVCLYPFEHTPYYREVWEHVLGMYADVCRQQGVRAGARLLHRAREQSVTRQGYFTYLNVAPTVHEQQTAQVLRRVMGAGGVKQEL